MSDAKVYRGVITGLTEAFVISCEQRSALIAEDARSEEVIRPICAGNAPSPLVHGGFRRVSDSTSVKRELRWPWSDSGDEAERVFRETYPAIHAHLNRFREQAIRRQDQGRYWWELRSCAYWDAFGQPKIVWPDISKLPRFSMDTRGCTLGNTAYTIPGGDYYLLGVSPPGPFGSISARLRSLSDFAPGVGSIGFSPSSWNNFRYPTRLQSERQAIAALAERCCTIGGQRYHLQSAVQDRLSKTFGEDSNGTHWER